MSEIFGARSLLYWWGVLTATMFIEGWLKQLAAFFRTSDTFSPQRIPFNIVPGLNSWIDGAGNFIRETVKFDPNAPLLTVGSTVIPSFALAFFAGFLLIILGILFLRRAIRSSIWFDDFIALGVIYIILRIVGHIVSLATSLPFANWFRVMVDNPFAAYIVIQLLLLFITFFGEGFQSKRAFWRALIASGLLSLFMYPREAATSFSYVIEALALFGAGLANEANVPFAAAWGVLGMYLAFRKLTLPECGNKNAQVETFGSDTTPVNVEAEASSQS
ncbi:MAG: hypothetical protein FJ009_04120 [Chloroflexi bacterium]|nr:hypothetical protein [Chloroflexota bacterium]